MMLSLHKKKKKFWTERQGLFIYGMLSIALLNFLVFFVYVNISSIMLAFQSPSIDGFTFINFENLFREMSLPDSNLRGAFFNTLVFFGVGLCIGTPLSLFFSYFIYKKIACYRLFRVVFYLPSILSVVVMTSLFSYMVEPSGLITKAIMKMFGLTKAPLLLGESRYALWTIIFYTIWTGFGVNIILFNGAMGRIPEEIIEYNQLEGVGYTRELVQVVLPLIWPTLSTVLVFAVVGLFNSSGPILFFTMGNYNTFTLSYWIFDQVVHKSVYEYSAAVGLFFTMIGLPLTLFVKWFLGKIGQDIEY